MSNQIGPSSSISPYQQRQVDPASGQVPAGFWLRALAYVIDGAVIKLTMQLLLLAMLLGGIGVGGLAGYVASRAAGAGEQTMAGAFGGALGGALLALAISLVVFVLLFFLYGACFESSRLQATPGKVLVGLVATDTAGRRLGFFSALGRNLAKFFSYLTVLIGFIMAGVRSDKRALHDLMAGSCVLKTPAVSLGRVFLSVIVLIGLSVAVSFLEGDQDSKGSKSKFRFFQGGPAGNSKSIFKFGFWSSDKMVRYKDERGVTHYVSSLDRVPEKYRSQAEMDPNLPEVRRYKQWGRPLKEKR